MVMNDTRLQANLAGSKTIFGWTKELAYGLLKDESADKIGDSETFEYVIRQLRLSSGVYRTTYRGRFQSVDPVVNEAVRGRFDSSLRLQVREWGCSDGLVSMEWAKSLSQVHSRLDFVTSDLIVYLVEASHGDAHWYLEPDGTPLQYTKRGRVVPLLKRPSVLFPIDVLISIGAGSTARRSISPLIPALKWERPYGCAPQHQAGWEFQQVSLLHPETRQFAQANDWFRVAVHSAFSPESEPCHVLRCMNLLNRNYFNDETLHQAALVAWKSLATGGLWVVGRTSEEGTPQQDVTIFERRDAGFHVVGLIGSGADMQRVLASMPLKVQ